jgi:hypothetical protein
MCLQAKDNNIDWPDFIRIVSRRRMRGEVATGA